MTQVAGDLGRAAWVACLGSRQVTQAARLGLRGLGHRRAQRAIGDLFLVFFFFFNFSFFSWWISLLGLLWFCWLLWWFSLLGLLWFCWLLSWEAVKANFFFFFVVNVNRVLETRFTSRCYVEKMPTQIQLEHANRAFKARFTGPKSSF